MLGSETKFWGNALFVLPKSINQLSQQGVSHLPPRHRMAPPFPAKVALTLEFPASSSTTLALLDVNWLPVMMTGLGSVVFTSSPPP